MTAVLPLPMLPAGYLLKRTAPPPGWLAPGLEHVREVCSVADCVNDDVLDVQGIWQHNGFGLANDPGTLRAHRPQSAAADGVRLFYFEAHPLELDSDGWVFAPAEWSPRMRLRSATVADAVVAAPAPSIERLGYDVVVCEDFLDHSPLSCNSMAATLGVNAHCLFDRLADAIAAIDRGAFEGCEPVRYSVFAVHRCTTRR